MTVVGMETPAAVSHKTQEVSLGSSPAGYGGRLNRVRRSASLTLAVGDTVRNNSAFDLLATGLLGTVAQAEAEVGVLAEAGRVRLSVDRGATQVLLLAEHVADACSLDGVFSKRRKATYTRQRGRLTPHSGTELISWAETAPRRAMATMATDFMLTEGGGEVWVGGLIVAAR
jgi:hypothetical protein